MSEFGIPNDHQLDMFDPAHIALKKQAEYLKEQIKPIQQQIRELEKSANDLCPHTNISLEYTYEEDEYGTHHSSWDDSVMKCEFCEKTVRMNKHKFINDPRETRDIFIARLKGKE